MPRPFQPPRPNFALMRALEPVNRRALVHGYFRVRSIDFPAADRERLTGAVNPATAAFIGPNHPEFGFDWMMDKEISTHVAPRMASWASHGIVATAPGFWLRNNLISHNGGGAAVEHSVDWALRGEGVLLHPEGSVHWTGDVVHPLFNGIAEMACEAARRDERPVFIVPVVWKLHYVDDISAALHGEMARIEKHLGLAHGGRDLSERFVKLQERILDRQMDRFGFHWEDAAHEDLFGRQEIFRDHLITDLESRYATEPTDDVDRRIARLQRVIAAERRAASTTTDRAQFDRDLDKAEEANRLGGFARQIYGGLTLTQEQIAESLKRHRAALVKGGLRNTLHNFLPTPFGARIAHVRVPEPIQVDPGRASGSRDERSDYVAKLIAAARRRMQESLDTINREIEPAVGRFRRVNPFARAERTTSSSSPVCGSPASRETARSRNAPSMSQ